MRTGVPLAYAEAYATGRRHQTRVRDVPAETPATGNAG